LALKVSCPEFHDVDSEDRDDSNNDNEATQPYHDEPQIMNYAFRLGVEAQNSLESYHDDEVFMSVVLVPGV
jgi:hypothetical protein